MEFRGERKYTFFEDYNSASDLYIMYFANYEMMLERNRTSYMYDEETAVSIVKLVKDKYVKEFNKLKNNI